MPNEPGPTVEDALLLELAELGMDMARRVHEAARATRDVDQLVALTNAFHQVGRGIRQSLALRARFAAGTVVTERAARSEAAAPPASPRPDVERADWNEYERPDWHTRIAANAERLDVSVDGDPDACRARIARDLTVVSRTPALAAIPALRAPAATLAGRAALLTGAALRLVNTS